MKPGLACFFACSTIWLLMGAAASQPAAVALPDENSCLQAAAAVAEKGARLATPRLYDQPAGLAVDCTDPKNPKVVAYVGPSWVVATSRPDGATAAAPPLGFVLDRGTGRLLARAHEVVAMPKPAVYYVDTWQIAATALAANDAVVQSFGGGLAIRLDLGGGNSATMNLQPGGNGLNLGGGENGNRIKFGSGTGKMVVRQIGAGGAAVQIIAISDDNAAMATCFAQKAAPQLEERFKAVLAGLGERPETTRVWPADARPRVSGVEGWSVAQQGNDNVAMWQPVADAQNAEGPGVVLRPGVVVNGRVLGAGPGAGLVYVAALVLHPYDLPPSPLNDGLADGKVQATRPAVVLSAGPEAGEWVGIEKIVQLEAPTQMFPGQFMGGMGFVGQPGVKLPMTTYQVRLLDLHRDVRRLIIRCQAPKDGYEKFAADFDKILKQMKIPDGSADPADAVVVPLSPMTYKAKK